MYDFIDQNACAEAEFRSQIYTIQLKPRSVYYCRWRDPFDIL